MAIQTTSTSAYRTILHVYSLARVNPLRIYEQWLRPLAQLYPTGTGTPMHFRDLPLEIQFRILKQANIQELQCFIHAGVLQPGQGIINYFADSPESPGDLSVVPAPLSTAQPKALINVVELFRPDRWDMPLLVEQLRSGHNFITIYGKGRRDSEPIASSGWNLEGQYQLTAWSPKLHILLTEFPEAHYVLKLYGTVVIHSQTLASPLIAFDGCGIAVISQCKAAKKFTLLNTGRSIVHFVISNCDDSVLQNMHLAGDKIDTLYIFGDDITLKDSALACHRVMSGRDATGESGRTFKEISRITFNGTRMCLDLSHEEVTLRSLTARNMTRLVLKVNRIMPPISGLDAPCLDFLLIRNSLDDRTPMAPEGVVDYSFCKSVKKLVLIGIIDPLFQAPLESLEELEIEYNDNILENTRRFEKLRVLCIKCGQGLREVGVIDAPSLLEFYVGHHKSDHPLDFVFQAAFKFRRLEVLMVADAHPWTGSSDLDRPLFFLHRILKEIVLEGVGFSIFEEEICFDSLRYLTISGRHIEDVLRLRFKAPKLEELFIHMHEQCVEVYGMNDIKIFEVTADKVIGDKKWCKGHKFTRCHDCHQELVDIGE